MILVAGPQIPQGLLQEHVRTVIRNCKNLKAQARISTNCIIRNKKQEFSKRAIEAAKRYKEVLDLMDQGNPIVSNALSSKKMKHADLDDNVNRFRGNLKLEWGATLSEPRGWKYEQRVYSKFNQDINGVHTQIKLNKSTGELSLYKRRGLGKLLPFTCNKWNWKLAFSAGVVSGELGQSDVSIRDKNRIHPTDILNSQVPPEFVRMALYSVEKRNETYSRESACYLPKSKDGRGINHDSSIPSSVFNEIDVYFRERDQAIFIRTRHRDLRLGKGENYCDYHVTEERFSKKETRLAWLELKPGVVGSPES